MFSTAPSTCLKTGNSGLLEVPSTWPRLWDGGSAALPRGSGILDVATEDSWDSPSILLGGAGGSLGRVAPSSARLVAGRELEELSRGELRLLRLTSGRLRPKRAMPALGELSICLEETSMDISVRREDSARLMPALGERGLDDSDGEDREEEEEKSEFRELRS